MWAAALAFALTLTPGDAAELTLSNARTTFGIHGAPRPNNKFLPGDELVLSFDIEGAKIDGDGKVRGTITMEVSDSDGKVMFRKAPKDVEAMVPQGVKTLPAYANLQVGLDSPAGTYTVKVKVTDRQANVTKEISQTCEVLPKDFGLVRATSTSDSDGAVPVGSFHKGKTGWINLTAVEFGRDANTKQPNLTIVMDVVDENGRSTMTKPSTGTVDKDVPDNAHATPLQFAIQVAQAGKYKVELKATDNVTGKTATLSIPLTITAD